MNLRTLHRASALLLLCVAFLALSGLRLVIGGWNDRSGRVAWLQAISGMYLVLFLVIHVSAVLFGRTALGLDTNFNVAAAGIHVPRYQWFFAPCYTLAVLALCAHVGCALRWQFKDSAQRISHLGLALVVAVGVCASTAITSNTRPARLVPPSTGVAAC